MSAMSEIDLDRLLIAAVSEAIQEPERNDPAVSADMACETALNALDDLMVLAAADDTAQHVMANRVFVGQILVRAQLVASFLMSKHPQLKVVSNG